MLMSDLRRLARMHVHVTMPEVGGLGYLDLDAASVLEGVPQALRQQRQRGVCDLHAARLGGGLHAGGLRGGGEQQGHT